MKVGAVALRKESVDRNGVVVGAGQQRGVALRKESVDRHINTISDYLRANRSLSARRAWIEISGADAAPARRMEVALRKESVDRNNAVSNSLVIKLPCRSPQGERG